MHSKENKDRGLKLTLQIKDSQYSIKGKKIREEEEEESTEQESINDQNSTMSDSANTSLNEDIERNGELSNSEEDNRSNFTDSIHSGNVSPIASLDQEKEILADGIPSDDNSQNTTFEQESSNCADTVMSGDVSSNTSLENEKESLDDNGPTGDTLSYTSIDHEEEICDNNDELMSNTSFEEVSRNFFKTEPEFSEDLQRSLNHPSDKSNSQENNEDNDNTQSPGLPNDKQTPAPQKEVPSSTTSKDNSVEVKKEIDNGVPDTTGDSSNAAENRGKKGTPTATDDDISDAETELAPEDERRPPVSLPLISVRKTEDLMKRAPQINGANEQCNVCCDRFPSPGALEQHRASAGHYSCSLSQECANQVFPSPAELNHHQMSFHQPPVQRLAQQVQQIPAAFTSPTYASPSPQQRNNVYMNSPQMGGSSPAQQHIGSGVVLSTVPSSPQPSIPNLPPGIQLSKRPAAQPPQSTSPKQRREEDNRPKIRLPDSITLTKNVKATESVTDMLVNRGITVVPSSSNRPNCTIQPVSAPVLPRSLMNTSAISITPSSQSKTSPSRPSNFAVPAPKPVPRVLTVDLTNDAETTSVPAPRRNLPVNVQRQRMRGPTGRSVCQICDKAFPTPQELSQHMACHRGGVPNRLAYECRDCAAQYPTESGLQAHRQKYHSAGGPTPDMGIPIVDLRQAGVMAKLASIGVKNVIPLSQLHSNVPGSAMFGLPIVAVEAAQNPALCNIDGIGESNVMPLGPLKRISFNKNRNTLLPFGK